MPPPSSVSLVLLQPLQSLRIGQMLDAEVLDDLRTNASYIYCGSFSQMLGVGKHGEEGKMPSIWEEKILRLVLCLYSPLVFDVPATCVIVNSANGQLMELDQRDNTGLLSAREKRVLILIDNGRTSKEIAEALCISINTVSRHRQEILGKLQVKNSIEACRVAKDLKLI